MYIHVLCFFVLASLQMHFSSGVDELWDAVWAWRHASVGVSVSADQSGRFRSSSNSGVRIKAGGGSLLLAAAFTLSSQARQWGIRNVSIDIPMVFVASVRQPLSANHNNLFTCIRHWQWGHRMSKSVYVVCQVCVRLYRHVFRVCSPLFACFCFLSACKVCVCVCRGL